MEAREKTHNKWLSWQEYDFVLFGTNALQVARIKFWKDNLNRPNFSYESDHSLILKGSIDCVGMSNLDMPLRSKNYKQVKRALSLMLVEFSI